LGLSPLTNNTAKSSFGEDLVSIRPAVAQHWRQKKKKKNTERPLKHKTLATSGAI